MAWCCFHFFNAWCYCFFVFQFYLMNHVVTGLLQVQSEADVVQGLVMVSAWQLSVFQYDFCTLKVLPCGMVCTTEPYSIKHKYSSSALSDPHLHHSLTFKLKEGEELVLIFHLSIPCHLSICHLNNSMTSFTAKFCSTFGSV